MTWRTLELKHTNMELAEILQEYVENVSEGVTVTDRDNRVAIQASKELIHNLKKIEE